MRPLLPLILCFLALNLSTALAKGKPPQVIDQLYLYMEQEVFLPERCKTPMKGVRCASSTGKLDLYAEFDGPGSFVLNIHEQPEEDLPKRFAMIKVSFTRRDGVVLRDITDFYDDYPTVRRGKQIQLVVRQWLKGIQQSFNPTYGFMPFK